MSNASESSRSKKDATDTEDFNLEKSGTMVSLTSQSIINSRVRYLSNFLCFRKKN